MDAMKSIIMIWSFGKQLSFSSNFCRLKLPRCSMIRLNSNVISPNELFSNGYHVPVLKDECCQYLTIEVR